MLCLSMNSTEETLIGDKALLAQWCAECVRASMESPANVVEVYGLQQASTEWTPQWRSRYSFKCLASFKQTLAAKTLEIIY